MAMAVSLPITCAATWVITSLMTGLTLPGMIDEPGWRSGIWISARPPSGPEPIHRMSLAIFMRPQASPLSAPLIMTMSSRAPCASKWSSASRTSIFSRVARISQTCDANFGSELMPVPTAVPPIASSRSPVEARSICSMPLATWRA